MLRRCHGAVVWLPANYKYFRLSAAYCDALQRLKAHLESHGIVVIDPGRAYHDLQPCKRQTTERMWCLGQNGEEKSSWCRVTEHYHSKADWQAKETWAAWFTRLFDLTIWQIPYFFWNAYRNLPGKPLGEASTYALSAELTVASDEVDEIQKERDRIVQLQKEARSARRKEDRLARQLARDGTIPEDHYASTSSQAQRRGRTPGEAEAQSRHQRLATTPGSQVRVGVAPELEDVEDEPMRQSRRRAEAQAKSNPRAKRVRIAEGSPDEERPEDASSSRSFGAPPGVAEEGATFRSNRAQRGDPDFIYTNAPGDDRMGPLYDVDLDESEDDIERSDKEDEDDNAVEDS